MSQEEYPKYIKVKNLKEANEKADLYSLREPIVYQYSIDGVNGAFGTDVEYLMSLREETKYDNVEKFKKVEITTEEQEVPPGWGMIHHTSKEVVLVYKGKQPKLSVIREAIIKAYDEVETWDTMNMTGVRNHLYDYLETALNEIEGRGV